MTKCDYCGDEVPKTQGKLVVETNGDKHFYCSGKCEKNAGNNRSHSYPSKQEE